MDELTKIVGAAAAVVTVVIAVRQLGPDQRKRELEILKLEYELQELRKRLETESPSPQRLKAIEKETTDDMQARVSEGAKAERLHTLSGAAIGGCLLAAFLFLNFEVGGVWAPAALWAIGMVVGLGLQNRAKQLQKPPGRPSA